MRLSCVGCLRRFIPVDDSLGVRPLLGDVGWGVFSCAWAFDAYG